MSSRMIKSAQFRELLSSEEVSLAKLRELCFQGCPDAEGVRATCWKLLLGYLPGSVKDWEKSLKDQREAVLLLLEFKTYQKIQKPIVNVEEFCLDIINYRSFYVHLMNKVLVNPHYADGDQEMVIDHPLNPNPESTWNRYFKDNDIIVQIDNDTRRLYPDMSFFQLPTPYPQTQFNTSAVLGTDALRERVDKTFLPSQQVATTRAGIKNISVTKYSLRCELPYSPLKQGEEAHWEVVERILFLYAKTNKGISYVQGMNEIIGPIYYVFAQHPDPKWKEHAEADTFFCFTNLMTEIGDWFTKKLDSSRIGIGGAMSKMMKLIQSEDPSLYDHLVKLGIDPTYFGFRWITLMLSQELLLPEVIRIWDSLFADDKRFNFLIYVCGAMVLSIKTELLDGDFSVCIKLLQNYPLSDTQKLLLSAQDLRQRHKLTL